MDKILKHVASSSIFLLISKVFNAGAQYLLILILGRFLGAADLGLFVLGRACILFCNMGSMLGFAGSLQKFIPKYLVEMRYSNILALIKFALSSVFLTSVFLAVLIYNFAGFIGTKVFHTEHIIPVLRLFAFSLPMYGILMVLLASIRSLGDMRGLALVENVLLPAGIVLISLFLFVFSAHLKSVIVAFVASICISIIIASLLLKKDLPALSYLNQSSICKRKIVRYSLPLMGTGIIGFFLMWTDTFMLGILRTAEDVGVYNGASRIAFLSNIALVSVNAVFGPTISKMYSQSNIKGISIIYKKTIKWLIYISLPIALLIIFFAENILALYGPSFTNARAALITLSIGQLVNVSVGSAGYLLTMTGRPNIEFFNTVACVLLNFLLNLYLIPIKGIEGAALATAISLSIINVLRAVENYHYLRIHPFSLQLIWPFSRG